MHKQVYAAVKLTYHSKIPEEPIAQNIHKKMINSEENE